MTFRRPLVLLAIAGAAAIALNSPDSETTQLSVDKPAETYARNQICSELLIGPAMMSPERGQECQRMAAETALLVYAMQFERNRYADQ